MTAQNLPAATGMVYTTLRASKIIETAERLSVRIAGQFPNSGLARIAGEVVTVARTTEADAQLLLEPNRTIRWLVAFVGAAGVATALYLASLLRVDRVAGDPIPLVQGLESAMNLAILVGLGVLGLTRLESRWKTKRALASLHRLRSLAHVVDMHQLTKDPSAWRPTPVFDTALRRLAPEQLVAYLDFCSELLALIGKLAALYGQSLGDNVVIQAVNEVEVLTTNLSRKIWQKIAIVSRDASSPNARD
jgi:hypothetical protein